MSNGIYTAAGGAIAQTNALDATANNIANASTPGYRADRITFKEMLGKARSADTTLVDTGAVSLDQAPGTILPTGNPLDVALQGDGYIGIQTAQGPRYTRAGNFTLNDQRQLVSADGNAVRGVGGSPISIPPEANDITIDHAGNVAADGAKVGQLEIVKFAPSQLKREGGTLFSASGQPQAGDPPMVQSGMLEGSNVNVVRGIVDLVKVSRTYESLMKMIQGYHTVESQAATTLGKPQ